MEKVVFMNCDNDFIAIISMKKYAINLSIASSISIRNIADDNDPPQPNPLAATQYTGILHIHFCFFVNEHIERNVFLCFFTDVLWLL